MDLSNCTPQDLKAIAEFNRIVLNHIEMIKALAQLKN